jgi:hypothetical protein
MSTYPYPTEPRWLKRDAETGKLLPGDYACEQPGLGLEMVQPDNPELIALYDRYNATGQ